MKTVKKRIDDLENQTHDKVVAVVSQNENDPDIWHDGPTYQRGPGMTWDQVLGKYPNDQYQIIKVVYVNNWRAAHE